jgi:hypothetical protein
MLSGGNEPAGLLEAVRPGFAIPDFGHKISIEDHKASNGSLGMSPLALSPRSVTDKKEITGPTTRRYRHSPANFVQCQGGRRGRLCPACWPWPKRDVASTRLSNGLKATSRNRRFGRSAFKKLHNRPTGLSRFSWAATCTSCSSAQVKVLQYSKPSGPEGITLGLKLS